MKLFQKPVWLVLCLSVTPSQILWAASYPPTIVVSASRVEQNTVDTPASITIVTREEIEGSGAANLLQLLQARGGVQIDSLYGHAHNATVDMRGFGPTAGSNTLILVDGRRLNNSSDLAAPDLTTIDLNQVKRIEIVQGSAGTLYGNQAVGGLINIITRSARNSVFAEAGLGSYDTRSMTVNLGQRSDNGLSAQVNARRETSDNYRDNNQTEYRDFNLQVDYDHDSGRLFIEQQAVNDDQQLPGSLFAEEMLEDRRQSAPNYDGDYSDTRSDITRIGLEQELSPIWRFEGEASYRTVERTFQTSFRSSPGSLSTQTRKVEGYNPRLIALFPAPNGEATLTTGLDLERTDYALITSLGPQRLDQSVDALYMQLTTPVTRTLSATLGVRRAKVENNISTGTSNDRLDDRLKAGSFGLVLRPIDGLRLFLRADENYRFATVEEHTNLVFGQPTGVKNQTGLSQEAGIEWQRQGVIAKAILYRLTLDDEISFDTTGFYNTNLERTRRKGVILEARWQTTPRLAFSGSFTYTDPEIAAGAFEGNRIPLVSARSARLGLDLRATEQWQLSAEGILRSDRAFGGDFANDFETLPGYGLLNLSSQYRSGPWRLNLRIDNLLDKAYTSSGSVGYDSNFIKREAYFPAPERSLWLTARYQFE